MNIQVFGYTFCLVIVINCVLHEARSFYTVNPYDYTLSKRSIVERRGFLKSFCAKRCQIGKGGIVCRCNGFHFAGKRTGNMPTYPEHQRQVVGNDPEQIVYKLLEENDKISVNPDKYTLQDGTIPQQEIIREIEEIFPEVMNGDLENRPSSTDIGELLEDFLRRDEI
ncbi:uncharacterized protein LOC123561314 [Mercenaria mercenaria]|uniref:uncharacterized protein LOC123561314 n=1 Tax=Mercenaria mercenaria TaxID=6596 RepID=UPI00234F32AA|nr:uncharacterized protein LOC123561314 [Mercenaria mercenaria]